MALYGGYFGAGIGILMLAALSVLGLTDIHQMNGLKALLGAGINGVAALYFIWAGMVYWPEFVVMVIGAIIGGYGGRSSRAGSVGLPCGASSLSSACRWPRPCLSSSSGPTSIPDTFPARSTAVVCCSAPTCTRSP